MLQPFREVRNKAAEALAPNEDALLHKATHCSLNGPEAVARVPEQLFLAGEASTGLPTSGAEKVEKRLPQRDVFWNPALVGSTKQPVQIVQLR